MLQYGKFYWLLNVDSHQSLLSLSKPLHMFFKRQETMIQFDTPSNMNGTLLSQVFVFNINISTVVMFNHDHTMEPKSMQYLRDLLCSVDL